MSVFFLVSHDSPQKTPGHLGSHGRNSPIWKIVIDGGTYPKGWLTRIHLNCCMEIPKRDWKKWKGQSSPVCGGASSLAQHFNAPETCNKDTGILNLVCKHGNLENIKWFSDCRTCRASLPMTHVSWKGWLTWNFSPSVSMENSSVAQKRGFREATIEETMVPVQHLV